MADKRIYIKTWSILKPFDKHSPTDIYYLKLSNEIKGRLFGKWYNTLLLYIYEEEIDLLCCFLTSYFEDIISETNIWNTFVSTHQQMYGKPLPLFEPEEYYPGDINKTDISFLLWYFLNTMQDEVFIYPQDSLFTELAEVVMEIFDKEYEYAPENEVLKAAYQIDENDFYTARIFIDNLLISTYLFYPDTGQMLMDRAEKMINKDKNDEFLRESLHELRDDIVHGTYTRLLGLKGKEWAAKLLGEKHPFYNDFLNISPKIHGLFLFKRYEGADIVIEHIASGKVFTVTGKSFETKPEFHEDDTIVLMGIVKWKNEWWFSGVYVVYPYSADVILDEKNSITSRMQVDFLDKDRDVIKQTLADQLELFKKMNGGLPIAFMPADEIEDYVGAFIDLYNKSLNLSGEEVAKAEQRAKKEGFLDHGKRTESKILEDNPENGLVFFNPSRGIEIAIGLNSAFSPGNNPYFDEEKTFEDLMDLLMGGNYSPELVRYSIDTLGKDAPVFNEEPWNVILNDLDFMLRFWKGNNYHARANISLTGNK